MKRFSGEFPYPYISKFLDNTLNGLTEAYKLRSAEIESYKTDLNKIQNQEEAFRNENLEKVKEEIIKPYDNKINKNFIDFKKNLSTIGYNNNLSKILNNILLLNKANEIVFNIFNNAVLPVEGITNKTLYVFIQRLEELEITHNIQEYKEKDGDLEKRILSNKNVLPTARYTTGAINNLTLTHGKDNVYNFKYISEKILKEIESSIDQIKNKNYTDSEKNILQKVENKLGKVPATITPDAQLGSENTNEQEAGGSSYAPGSDSSLASKMNDVDRMPEESENNQLKQRLKEVEDVIICILNEKEKAETEAKAKAEFLFENLISKSEYIEVSEKEIEHLNQKLIDELHLRGKSDSLLRDSNAELETLKTQLHSAINTLVEENENLHNEKSTLYTANNVHHNPLFNRPEPANILSEVNSNNIDITPPSTSESASSSASSSLVEQESSFLNNSLFESLFTVNNNFRIKERIRTDTDKYGDKSEEEWAVFLLKKPTEDVTLFEFEAKIDKESLITKLKSSNFIDGKKHEINGENLKNFLTIHNLNSTNQQQTLPKLALKDDDNNIIDSVTTIILKTREIYKDITFSEKKSLNTDITYSSKDKNTNHFLNLQFNRSIINSAENKIPYISIQKKSKNDNALFDVNSGSEEFMEIFKSMKDYKLSTRIFETADNFKDFKDNLKLSELNFNDYCQMLKRLIRPDIRHQQSTIPEAGIVPVGATNLSESSSRNSLGERGQ